MPVIELLSIGSELVLGQTLDTNAHWLSGQLAALGLPVTWRTTVADDLPELTEAIRAASRRADVVIASGGLGPTRDDMTRDALAAAAGVALRRDDAAFEHIAALFRRWGRPMPRQNEVQAMIPLGGEAIPNPNGTAPGIAIKIGRAMVYAMPGVPREMTAMFHEWLSPRLAALAGGAAVIERRLHCFGAGESLVGERIHDLMDPARRPRVGTTVSGGLVTIRIVSRADNRDEARAQLVPTEVEVRERLGSLVFGSDDETLESVVVGLLKTQRKTLAVAESVTGGLIADKLTDVPGVSGNLLEGVVAYSNAAKTDLLGVPAALFETVGAVSEPVAKAMAEGVRRRAQADLALSTTGIAGPTGGSAEKPIGLVYVALAMPTETHVQRTVFGSDRRTIKLRAALSALNLLRLHLVGTT
jgi:nicotinamide-nucleotide amidase